MIFGYLHKTRHLKVVNTVVRNSGIPLMFSDIYLILCQYYQDNLNLQDFQFSNGRTLKKNLFILHIINFLFKRPSKYIFQPFSVGLK